MSHGRGTDRYHDGGEHDPNHPPSLNISPSWTGARASVSNEGWCGDNGEARSFQDPHLSSSSSSTATAGAVSGWEKDSAEDIEQWGIAGRIWEAAYLFKQYLCPPRDTVEFDPPCPLFVSPKTSDHGSGPREDLDAMLPPPLHVLELGSGAGYVGLSCARELDKYRKAKIDAVQNTPAGKSRGKHRLVLTDLDNVVPLMTRNAQLAGFISGEQNDKMSVQPARQEPLVDVFVRPLPWGSTSHAAAILQNDLSRGQDEGHLAPLDFILCSDLVYFPHLLPPLLRSLITLTTHTISSPTSSAGQTTSSCLQGKRGGTTSASGPPEVLMAYKIRSYAKEESFWSALGVWFQVEIINSRNLSPRSSSSSSSRLQTRERTKGAWHRFGSLKLDLISQLEVSTPSPADRIGTEEGSKEGGEEEEDKERSDDAYFLFLARRKPSTFLYHAPQDDGKLMDGFMAVPSGLHAQGREEVPGFYSEVDQREMSTSEMMDAERAPDVGPKLVRGEGGADFIECALLGSMDVL